MQFVTGSRLNPAMISKHLTQAEEQVAIGARNIAKQRQILAELEADGHYSSEARTMLANFERNQRMNLFHRERVMQELAHSRK